jgi:hypothetical protein
MEDQRTLHGHYLYEGNRNENFEAVTKKTMALSPDLLLKLGRKYDPSTTVATTFRGNDIVMQTDAHGNAVVAFIGKLESDGKIKGKRYTRTLKAGADGRIIKDHWDLKGKT